MIILILVWIPMCFIAGNLAEDKGHSFFIWAVLTFFMGPIGFLGAVGLSDRAQRRIIALMAMNQGVARDAIRDCGGSDGIKEHLRQSSRTSDENGLQEEDKPWVNALDNFIG